MKKLLPAILAVLLFAAWADTALAWKPYMHNHTGDKAYNDVVADGEVTIAGREYAVRPEVVAALQAHKPFYNAGVVGPDGFPDLVFGQSQIHPVDTGKWLRHILSSAWAAQGDPSYSATEKQQILAFAYGYLTHAAGDMWAHTMVNDFALGVFPGVSEILTDVDMAEIAVRHLISEGYVGDATPGYDGNSNRTPIFGLTNEDGDLEYSDDSTPGTPYDAPHRFIYETLVNPNNPLPVGTCGDGVDDDDDGTADDGCPGQHYTVGDDPEPLRGPLIDFFIDSMADLQVSEARFAWDSEFTDCAIIDPDCYSRTKTLHVNTVRGMRTTTVDFQNCEGATIGCLASPVDFADDIINNIAETYLEHWIEDVDIALRHWGELGLASTKALFDAQSHRNAQNFECRTIANETSVSRANCEDGVGMVDVLLYEATPFINDYLLSALGAPDALGDLLDALGALSTLIEDILGPALNPITAPLDELKEYVKELIKDEIEETLGVDLDQLKSFLTSPTYWMDVSSVTVQLPVLGNVTLDLFAPGTHARLDEYMGLGPGHHDTQTVTIPGLGTLPSSGLADTAEWDPDHFAAAMNTVRQSKLVLMDGPGLNSMLKDVLVSSGRIKSSAVISTYPAPSSPTNVMFHPLSGSVPWLRSIDSDHAWRFDGNPRFCTAGTAGCPTGQTGPPSAREEHLNAGNGTFPIWESCLLRPAFRTVFVDWENPPANAFPDLGDVPSSDPADPLAPATSLALSGTSYTAPGGTVYVGASHTLTLTGSDAVFTDSTVGLQYRVYKSGTTPGAWQSIGNGGTFSIGGADGLYVVEYRSEDPCHTFDEADSLPAGAIASKEFFLDTTPPEITITSPAPEGVVFDTDDFSSVTWTVTDAGSGVDASTVGATFDGAAATMGQVLDMFLLYPGNHFVVVSAADNLGNAGSLTRRFEVHATAESLVSNVQRACTEGLIQAVACNSLLTKVEHARDNHADGQHSVEQHQVGAWVNELEALQGKKVDAATAARFIAFGNDLIARNG